MFTMEHLKKMKMKMNIETTEDTRIANGTIGKHRYTAFAEWRIWRPEGGWEVILIVHNNFGGIVDQIRRVQFSGVRERRQGCARWQVQPMNAGAAIRATINEWKDDNKVSESTINKWLIEKTGGLTAPLFLGESISS